MRLSKEEFCEAINKIDRFDSFFCKLNNLIETALDGPLEEPVNYLYELVTKLCDFTEEERNDFYGTTLDFFCYDLDFGRKYEPGKFLVNGKEYELRTPEQLYDFLVSEPDK